MENQEKITLSAEIAVLEQQLQDVTPEALEEAVKKEYESMKGDVEAKYTAACTEALTTCSTKKASAEQAYHNAVADADAAYSARLKEIEADKAKFDKDIDAYVSQVREQNVATIQKQATLRTSISQKKARLQQIIDEEEEAARRAAEAEAARKAAEEAARKKAEEEEKARLAEEQAKKAAQAAASRPRIRF